MTVDTLHTIRLYGTLGRQFGRSHRYKLEGASPAEALSALMHMVPGFRRFLIQSKERGVAFHVFVGRRNLGPSDLRNPVPSDCEIRVAPALRGRKAGVFQIILGAILVAAGAYVDYITGGTGSAFGHALISAGIGMIAGGVVQMLTPVARLTRPASGQGQKANTTFNGPVNTIAQGNPLPVFYGGPMVVGSMVASAGIRVKENDYTPTPTNGTTGFMGGGGVHGFNSPIVRNA